MPETEQEKNRGLRCDDCGKGYADCRCPPTWSTDEERKARAAEIRAIKGQVMRDREFRAAEPEVVKETLAVTLPSSLANELIRRSEKGKCSVSEAAEELLSYHSGNVEKRLESWGKSKRVMLTVSSVMLRRLKARADGEKTTVSKIVQAHLEKELYFEMSE